MSHKEPVFHFLPPKKPAVFGVDDGVMFTKNCHNFFHYYYYLFISVKAFSIGHWITWNWLLIWTKAVFNFHFLLFFMANERIFFSRGPCIIVFVNRQSNVARRFPLTSRWDKWSWNYSSFEVDKAFAKSSIRKNRINIFFVFTPFV